MDNTVTEILITAKEILESEVDWCQRRLYIQDEDNYGDINITSACAIGALNMAIRRLRGLTSYSSQEYWDIRMEAEERLGAHIPPNEISVPSFNDRLSTTKEDVLLMFKGAINHG